MESDLSVQNSLVSLYAKCGSVDDAYKVFHSIDTLNTVSYNSMINGFAQNGYGKEALELFTKMEGSGVDPNDITFLGVLSACTHVLDTGGSLLWVAGSLKGQRFTWYKLFNWPILPHMLLDVLKDETKIMIMDSCLKYHYVPEAIWVPCNDA
ncbi:Pentatricopeptide repeat-containing protein [Artemisia annua]|uniref:Pentatricopeptide repeat-containing protein n=1 Tax=Artemisia annua TaxID=35608 RepID=A0A2U1KWQ3_ARTAN|nr:Pentatricopeptide repeat-containing protein [Artemisia annua]